MLRSPVEVAKQVGRIAAFTCASYAIGAVLFVAYVGIAMTVENRERASRIK